MKLYGVAEVKLYEFLTSVLDISECPASRYGRLSFGIHWLRGWMVDE